MSRTLTLAGFSDDVAILTDDGAPAEHDAYNGAQFHLIAPTGQMQIALTLDDNSGCWHVALGQTDEAHPMPKWPIATSQADADYSVLVTIEAPDDTIVRVIE